MIEPQAGNYIDKPSPPVFYRWSVLVVISLAMFGNYYVYDAVSPIADLLKEQLGFSDRNIGTLNAIYSVPNVIMVLIGGIIIDRIGVKKATLLFGVLCFVGAAITEAEIEGVGAFFCRLLLRRCFPSQLAQITLLAPVKRGSHSGSQFVASACSRGIP